MIDEPDQPAEPDFLDILDLWDEPLDYDDEDEGEPFVPMYAKPWFRSLALVIALAMFLAVAYSGLRALLGW